MRYSQKKKTWRGGGKLRKLRKISGKAILGLFSQCEWMRTDSGFEQNGPIFAVRMTAKRQRFWAKWVNFRNANDCEKTTVSSKIGQFSRVRMTAIKQRFSATYANSRSANDCENTAIFGQVWAKFHNMSIIFIMFPWQRCIVRMTAKTQRFWAK